MSRVFDWNGKCFKAIYIVYHNLLECLDFGCLCLSNTISQVHNTMCNINNTVIVSKYTCSVKCQYTVVIFFHQHICIIKIKPQTNN